MVLNELVGKFPKVRSSLTGPFIRKYAHPELLSWISFILAIVSGYLFSRDMLLYASLAYLASGFFDILDGDMARKYGRASVFGDFLDHSFDRLSDLAVLVGIGFSSFVSMELALATYISVILVSYMGTQAHAVTRERLYAGLLGRADRVMLVVVGGLLSSAYPNLLFYVVVATFVLSTITFLQRFITLWMRLRKK